MRFFIFARLARYKRKISVEPIFQTAIPKFGKSQSGFHYFLETLGDDYYKMFEAEEKVEVIDKNTNKWLKAIWREKYGAPNHAFDTYVYNKTALEWKGFWNYAKEKKAFYWEEASK